MADERERDGIGAGAPTDRSLTTVELDEVLAPRPVGRRRAIQATAVLLPLLVVAALALHSALPPGPAATTVMPTPTLDLPTAPLTVQSNVSFGTLTLNGKQVKGSLPQQLNLRQGANTLTFDAPPFPRVTCLLHGPVLAISGADPVDGSSDRRHCAYSSGDSSSGIVVVGSGSSSSGGVDSGFTADLTIMFSGADLSPGMQVQARQAVDRALSSLAPLTGTVPVGASFATGLEGPGIPVSQRATQPLTATLTYSLFVPDSLTPTSDFGFPCASGLCGLGAYWPSPPAAAAWMVAVSTNQRWRFTTASGTVMGDATFVAAGQTNAALTYDRASGWQLAPISLLAGTGTSQLAIQPDQCQVAVQVLQGVMGPVSSGVSTNPASAIGAGSLPACEIDVLKADGTKQGRFMWQFGVLSAMDAAALAPSLPVASAAEIAAINSEVPTPGGS